MCLNTRTPEYAKRHNRGVLRKESGHLNSLPTDNRRNKLKQGHGCSRDLLPP